MTLKSACFLGMMSTLEVVEMILLLLYDSYQSIVQSLESQIPNIVVLDE